MHAHGHLGFEAVYSALQFSLSPHKGRVILHSKVPANARGQAALPHTT